MSVPPAIEELVARLLEKEAKRRPSGARELLSLIENAAAQSGLDLPHLPAARSMGPSPSVDRISAVAPAGPWTESDSLAKTDYGLPASVPEPAPRAKASSPRLLLVAVAGGCLVLGMIVVFLVVGHGNTSEGAEGGAAVGSANAAPPKPTRATPEQLAAATTPAALEALAKELPTDPAVRRAWALAEARAGQVGVALGILKDLDPSAADDDVIDLVVHAAQRPETADDAFALLEGPLGAPGVDGLVELQGSKSQALKTRATRLLARQDIRAKASPAASVLLDVRAANGCAARHELLARAKDDGDARLLPSLKAMKVTRGCGFLGARDCWSCMRRDDALDDAVRAIEARGK